MENEMPYHRIWNDIGAGMNSCSWYPPICEKCKYFNANMREDRVMCYRFNILNYNFRPKEFGEGHDVKCYEAK